MDVNGYNSKVRKFLVTSLLVASLGILGFGMVGAMKSEAFLVRNIEVKSTKSPPGLLMGQSDIIHMTAIPLGRVSLFTLDLRTIENRLLQNEWIQSVRLEKKFANTLLISVTYRNPIALIQKSKGELAYVDSEGQIFGSAGSIGVSDLPLISGINLENTDRLKKAIELAKLWEDSKLGSVALVSTIHWDPDRGFRMLVSYPRKKGQSISAVELDSRIRTFVDIGHEVDVGLETKLVHISDVIHYLSSNSIAVRQIWADVGKKIVVKMVHGT